MSKIKTLKDALLLMSESHTNLNAYGAVIALMEGGMIYGGRHAAARRIIKIARAEQQKELALHNKACQFISNMNWV